MLLLRDRKVLDMAQPATEPARAVETDCAAPLGTPPTPCGSSGRRPAGGLRARVMWLLLALVALAPAAPAESQPRTPDDSVAAAAAVPSSTKQLQVAVVEFWVDCERGSDAADGTSVSSAFATMRRARDAVRAADRAASDDMATVNLVGGRVCRSWLQQDGGGAGHSQAASLQLDHRDSRVTWRAVGSPVVLSGGVPTNASDWKPLTPAQRRLFKASAAKMIVGLDLEGVVADIGRLKGLSYPGGDACIKTEFYEESGLELLHASPSAAGTATAGGGGRKLVMARFPDLVEPPVPDNWLNYRDPNNTVLGITIDASPEQQAAWAQQIEQGGQLFSHGLWKFNWADSHRRVLKASPAAAHPGGGVRLALQQHGDFTDRDCELSAAAAGEQGGHVYVYNAHYELDTPGEYTIDHKTKTLYFWPPADLKRSAFELSVATSLLTINGAHDIVFDGLNLRGARGAGVVIVNSSGVLLANATLSDTGMSALNITGGLRCGASNMTLVRGGTGGAVLEGGDRQTLTPSSHFVRGSTVRDCNRWVMNYAPLVLMAGVGQVVTGSVLADAPQMAVFVQGNSHHLADSQIRNVVQQCNDCGSFYFGRDWTYRGMRISGCNFSLPGPMWGMPWGANGIYADDFSSSVDVVGNTFNLGAKMRMVFFSNGGRDHSFVNNVIRPLSPNTVHGVTPVARLNNNCHGPCTDCIFSEPYHTFLNRVPYNTSCAGRSSNPPVRHARHHLD